MLALFKSLCYIGDSGISGTPGNSHNHVKTPARITSKNHGRNKQYRKGSATMDQPTTPTNKKAAKKSTALKDTSTARIIAHLVYRHRVGLLITNNMALIGYIISTLV